MLNADLKARANFGGETENLETGEPIYFEGEVDVLTAELYHDGRHFTVGCTQFNVYIGFENCDDVFRHVESSSDDHAAFSAHAVEAAREVGLAISGDKVADAIVKALSNM